MKRIIWISFLLVFTTITYGQKTIKGRILDQETKEPLAFTNIISKENVGTISDTEGFFTLNVKSDAKAFEVSYIGFEKKKIPIDPNKTFYIISLVPVAESLETVILSGKYVNPAIAIIKKVIATKPKNDYRKKNKKYSFSKYYKFLVTAYLDSIDGKLDSIYHNGKFAKIDSSQYEFKKELRDKDLFLMESVTKVNGIGGVEKNKVIASRTAGFKNPMYELLALQTMNQNVYDDNYKFLIREYLGPLTKRSFKQYKYELDDSLMLQNRKLYVLSYKNTSKPLISGKLFIDKKSFAIAKMTLNTYKEFELRTEHNFNYYPKYDTWFPTYSDMYIQKAGNKNSLSFDGVLTMETYKESDSISHTNKQNALDYMYAKSITVFKDITIGKLHEDKIVYNLQIDPNANKQSEDFWNHYRETKQTKRELKTYTFTDSLVEKEGIEDKINKLRKLSKGYYPTKYVDIPIAKLLDYNAYEGYRLSLGGITNSLVSDKFSLESYVAYGFKDKAFKYHGQLNYKLHHMSQTFLHMGYTKDIEVSAGFGLENSKSSFLGKMAIDKFYMSHAYNFGISHLFTNTLKTNLSLKKQNIDILYDIQSPARIEFKDTDLTSLSLHTEFQPFSKFFLSPEGRTRLKEGFPKFYLNIEKSLPNWQTSSSDFYRIDFQTNYKKTYLNKHHTDLIFKLGYASQNTPLTHIYSPTNNGYSDRLDKWYTKFHIGDNDSFETLYNLEFADSFITTAQVSHTFSKLKLSEKYNFDIRLISRAAWGTSYAGHRYDGIQTLEKGYFETGMEFNRLFKIFKQGFGVGFYYRLGHYSYQKSMDNLTVRLTVTPSVFLK